MQVDDAFVEAVRKEAGYHDDDRGIIAATLAVAAEADAKAARIAELERLLKDATEERDVRQQEVETLVARINERSPGVMPDVVTRAVKRLRGAVSDWPSDKRCADELEAYFAPPEGHEWQPVTAESPITAEDVGRKVYRRSGGVDEISGIYGGCVYFYGSEICNYPSGGLYEYRATSFDITHILRPIATPFVFTGEPGRYQTNNCGVVTVILNFDQALVLFADNHYGSINPDGTFAGGKITGRV